MMTLLTFVIEADYLPDALPCRYAFAMYTNDAEASNAIRMFNNYMIRPSWQLGK